MPGSSPLSNPPLESAHSDTRKNPRRSIWFQLHFWIGWIAAVPVILVCISGGVLAFDKYLKKWEFPEQYKLNPIDKRLSIDEVLDVYRNADPKLVVHHLGLPESPEHAYGAYVSVIDKNGKRTGGGYYIVNPYTGELKNQADKFSISGLMTDLHRHLAAGKTGQQIVAISSLILAATCMVGLVLWWPMRGRTFARAWKRGRVLDWHNALGLLSMAPLIIMALTGVIMTYSSQIFPVLDKLQKEPSRPADPVVEFNEGMEKLPVGISLAKVEENFPLGRVTGVQPTGSAKSPYVFFVTPKNGSEHRICMDPYTGEELSRYDGKPRGPVGWFRKNYFKFHTLAFNPLTATIWGVFSMVGGILAITGLWISIKRWRAQQKTIRNK